MIDCFYEPLPDLEKAVCRIGCADLEIRHDIKTLDALVKGFQSHVPYENLTVSVEKKIPSLAVKDLYDKFVVRNRGGYCFEMNGFFWAILKDLGFDVYSVSAYVLEYHDDMGDLGHRANVAVIDGRKYITDVGFGGKNVAPCAVPLDGSVKNGFFVLYDEKEREYTLCRSVSEEDEIKNGHEKFLVKGNIAGKDETYVKIILFRDFKAYPQEFYLPNIAVFYLPDNPMIKNVIVNFRNEKDEVYTIFNDEFRGKTAEGFFERKIESKEDFNNILQKYFAIVL